MKARTSCSEIRPELSALLDEELDNGARGIVREHLQTCDDCKHTLAALERTRRVLRARPVEPVPDLSTAIESRIRRSQRAPEWRSLGRIAAVAAAIAAVVVATSWPRGDRPQTVARAGEVTAQLQRAAGQLSSYRAEYTLLEKGVPGKGVRRYRASIAYAAPESVRLTVSELGASGRGSNDFTLTASPRALSLREFGSRTTTINRRPFDGSVSLPTDMILPLRSLADEAAFEVVGRERLGDRDTFHVRLPYGTAAPLVASLQAGGEWRPFHPGDVVDLWLEAETWVPVRFEVQAGSSRDRSLWASREEVVDRPGDTLLSVKLTSLSKPDVLPPRLFRIEQKGVVNDAGFSQLPFASVAEEIQGLATPAGLEPYRAGRASGTTVVAYADGMFWLRIQERPGASFESLLAGAPEELAFGATRFAYYLPASEISARKIVFVGRDSTITFEGNLPRQRLLEIAQKTAVPGLRAPREVRGPNGSVTRFLGGTPSRGPSFAQVPTWMPAGYEVASSVMFGTHDRTVVTVLRRPESELEPNGIRITQTRGVDLPEPSAQPSLPLVFDGKRARWFPERGELQWLDGPILRSVSVPSLELSTAERIAEGLR